MGRIAIFRLALIAAAAAAVVGMLPACGGDDGTDAAPELQAQPAASAGLALEGQRVSGRDQALQIVARGVVAPLVGSELAHAVLARAFERRANAPSASPPAFAGDRWVLALDAEALGAGTVLDGLIAIDIDAAGNAEGLILRGEAGFVRALLRFERIALHRTGQIDGAIVLEVSRTAAGAGAARRSQADALSISDGTQTLHWSYLNIEVDAQQLVQTLNVVSDLSIDGSDRVWLDVTTSNASARRYIATGVVGFLKARLTLQMAADGGWMIDVDNDKDDRVDFVVQASAAEARALMLGL